MTNIVLASAKYLMILAFALFTFISFLAQRDKPDEDKKGTFFLQRFLIFAVFFLAFVCIFINVYQGTVSDVKPLSVTLLFAGQFVYLILVMSVLPRIFHLSQGLHNCMCMLLNIGFIIQTRLSFNSALKHFLLIAASTVAFVIALILCRRIRGFFKMTWVYYFTGLVLLIVVFIFARVSLGAKISINIGPISIQPFEFVKILFVLFVAGAFNKANNFKTVLITAVGGVVFILIMVACTELGTALILAIVYVLMLYVATKKVGYLIICIVGFAIACVAAYMLFSHVRIRVQVWLDPWSDINNTGYQITQSLFAIGTGGWLGRGLYNGSPKNVPMVSNDFVFSAIAEELGGIFCIFLLLLNLCFVLMTFRIALRVSKSFYKLAAFGLGSAYGLQVFLTVGGALKFVPSTGINLPFISSGGSSLVASMITCAIIQALYVISEADVKIERELIQNRIFGTPVDNIPYYEDPLILGGRELKENRRKDSRHEYDEEQPDDSDVSNEYDTDPYDYEEYDNYDGYEDENAGSRDRIHQIDNKDI